MTHIFFTPLRDPRKKLFLYELLVAPHEQTEQFLFKPKSGLRFDVEIVARPEDAQVIVESSPVTHGNLSGWVKSQVRQAYGGKQLVVQVGGDLSHDIFIDDAIVLKVTQYRKLKRPNEVVMPPFCEDLGTLHGVSIREKSEKPVVSFCGWAGFRDASSYLKYCIKILLVDLKILLRRDPSLEVFKKGMYFRRRSIGALKHSPIVGTSFVIRRSFSGSTSTIALDPARARQEYLQNMVKSDFVLAPKGDANYSVRFFEALSLGRVPILIDTDTCLPFADKIDYSKCALVVSYKDIERLPQIVADFYAALSPEAWRAMQQEARRVFVEYLRYDSFWNLFLKDITQSQTQSQ